MAQNVPFDAYLGASKTGLAIGATIYLLDGSTVDTVFSTTGFYEAPSGSGAWHHAGLSLPDAGGVIAVGIAATEYMRVAVGVAPATLPTVADIDTQLSNAHGNGNWATATGFATPTNVSDAQTAIITAIPSTAAIVDAINAYAVETGVSFDTVLKNIYAVIRGRSLADDSNPTQIVYYAPDNTTVRVTHNLTDVERTNE